MGVGDMTNIYKQGVVRVLLMDVSWENVSGGGL